MEILFISLALILSVVGLAGSVLPVLPGAPLNLAALVLLFFIGQGTDPALWIMLAFGLLTGLSLLADYALPAHSVKRYGATALGVIGAVLGLLVGFLVFSLPGLLLGTFLGAVLGELLAGKELSAAIKAGAAGVSGSILAIVFKTILALGMTIYLLLKLF